jgi:outer membrane protein TolC
MIAIGRPSIGRIGVLALSLVALTGCASFSSDGGMATVVQKAASELKVEPAKLRSDADAAAVRERVAVVLEQPLTAEGAVQIALINNRGLQARYNALGISEAAYVASTLPENPTLAYQRISREGVVKTETSLSANVISLLTMPIRRDIGERQFRAAQYRTIEATYRMAADTRRAYYRAAAAQHVAVYLERALASADAAADLTRRLGQTGASGKLDQARAASFHAEIANQLRRARLNAHTTREALTRTLGLWGTDANYTLPDALPKLPEQLDEIEELEAEAIRRRVDLIAARQDLDSTARALGLTQATRFVSVLELSGIRERERTPEERTRSEGYEIAIQIPIFDLGEVSVRRAHETYMQAVNQLAEMAINIRSEARAAYQTYNASYEIARQYQNFILPLRRTINEETLLRYNGMLIDAFQLLTTASEGIAANTATIEAIRDFYLAQTDFQTALIGGGGSGAVEAIQATAPSGGGPAH